MNRLLFLIGLSVCFIFTPRLYAFNGFKIIRSDLQLDEHYRSHRAQLYCPKP